MEVIEEALYGLELVEKLVAECEVEEDGEKKVNAMAAESKRLQRVNPMVNSRFFYLLL